MRLSQFHLHTNKETPADSKIISHQLMLKSGMIKKLASGLYTWSPLGLRVLRKVESVVRDEMTRAGAIELLMPSIQPSELWVETERWQKFGKQLLKINDRKGAEYCYGPTHEEVITDLARNELTSYKQLPINFYQIQTKFRDEIRPRFGIMRAREFLMKDAYSFHETQQSLEDEYQNMYDTYCRIFTKLGLRFRPVLADTGAIGGNVSHEFHVLAESGEDTIAFSSDSDYAANIELAQAYTTKNRPNPTKTMRRIETPTQKTCEAVAKLLNVELNRTVKSIALTVQTETGKKQFTLVLIRGDHTLNETKLAKILELSDYQFATELEIANHLGCKPGFLGPVEPQKTIRIIADKSVAIMSDFIVGSNHVGFHIEHVNWKRDLAEPDLVADIRNVMPGDQAPDGKGTMDVARGIEVGHIFQLGNRYTQKMNCTVLNANGKAITPVMGCYGIGISRIVGAAIEQNFDESGIIWPEEMAPWKVAICIINPKNDPAVSTAAQTLYENMVAAGIETILDDRELRPGAMFADMDLIGIPHRIVVSSRGLKNNTFEYQTRTEHIPHNFDEDTLISHLLCKLMH